MFAENPAVMETQNTIAESKMFRLKSKSAKITISTEAIKVHVPKKAPTAHNTGAIIIKMIKLKTKLYILKEGHKYMIKKETK